MALLPPFLGRRHCCFLLDSQEVQQSLTRAVCIYPAQRQVLRENAWANKQCRQRTVSVGRSLARRGGREEETAITELCIALQVNNKQDEGDQKGREGRVLFFDIFLGQF